MLKWARAVVGRVQPAQQRLEEEIVPMYSPFRYARIRIGNVLHDKYSVVGKLGYGQYSTVWMAQDRSLDRYVAIKVLTSDCFGGNRDEIGGPELFEREILKVLSTSNPSHPGYAHVPKILDTFSHSSENGEHECLVYTPMTGGLEAYQKKFPKWRIPPPIMKRIVRQVLLGLDYAHSCNIIHCDIDEKNILLKLEDDRIIAKYLKDVSKAVEGSQSRPDRPVLSTLVGFSPDVLNVGVRVMDWGAGCFSHKHLVEKIYTPISRPPEVILGADWNSKVDIWALGLLVWRLVETMYLFNGDIKDSNEYDTHKHVGQIVYYLGPAPLALLLKCKYSDQYFDEKGSFRSKTLDGEEAESQAAELSLEDAEVVLKGEAKADFLVFIRSMLCWDPQERKSARELLGDKWLNTPDTEEELASLPNALKVVITRN